MSELVGESLWQSYLQILVLSTFGLPDDYLTLPYFEYKIIPNSYIRIFSIAVSLLSLLYGFNSFHLSKVSDSKPPLGKVLKYMITDIFYLPTFYCILGFIIIFINFLQAEISSRASSNVTDNITTSLESFVNSSLNNT